MDMSIDIKTSQQWDLLISGKNLVAADFWAPWCPYCVRLKPIFEEVAREDKHGIEFVKVNVDEEPDVASRYGIQGIPVIKFLCEGKELGEIVGYLPKEPLKKEIERIAGTASACLSNTSLRR